MIIIFGIFATIMRKLVIVLAENQHSQLVSPNSARKLQVFALQAQTEYPLIILA